MGKRIKILYTIPNFNTAGSGKVVYDLVNGLDSEKFEVEIACGSNKGAFFKEIETLNVPIHIVDTTTSYRPYFRLYSRMRPIIKFFRENKYDIIHSWHWSSDWTEVLAARLAGVKWVYTKKAMSWGNKHWKIRSYLANFIITLNDEMKFFFPYKKKQEFIPLGVDTSYYNPNLFLKPVANNLMFNIITVANLVPVKKIEVLIKAIYKLEDPSIVLTIIGDDTNEYGFFLKELCRELNMEHQVKFEGKRGDVRDYLVNSDLYVISSKNEGMPMALVEAMCMGIPVLGSDISGINFVLKNFPDLLFTVGNKEHLAQKIKYIQSLSYSKRNNLGTELRKYVVENFNHEIFITAHQKIYNEILN